MSKYAKAWLGPMIIVVSLIVLFVYLAQNGVAINIEATVPGFIVAVFPGLLITLLSLGAVTQLRATNPLVIGAFGATGIGLAVLLGEMYTQNIISDAIINPFSLAQLQTTSIIIAIVLGGAMYSRGD